MTGRGGQAKHADPAEQRISTLQWLPPVPSKYLKRESVPNNPGKKIPSTPPFVLNALKQKIMFGR
jgi:hypothetical protein